MYRTMQRNRCAPALLTLLVALGACDEGPGPRDSIAPRQDPEDEPPPVTETPFEGIDLNMLVSDLDEEELPALCEMAWHWLTHPQTERRDLYTRARCLQAVDETKLEGVAQCEEKLARCEETLPVDVYPSTICGLDNVAEAAQCDVPLKKLQKCVTGYAAKIEVAVDKRDCGYLVNKPKAPLKVPKSCWSLPPACAAAVGLY